MSPRQRKRSGSSTTDRDGYWFDNEAADRACEFIHGSDRWEPIRHPAGDWAGEPFILEPWQIDGIIRPAFGWKRPDGRRRYRVIYVTMAKGNGKSALASLIAGILLYADGVYGAQIYAVAADRPQAGIVFSDTKGIVDGHEELRGCSEILRNSIWVPATSSSFRVISADAPGKHGLRPHGIIFDELHAQRSRDLWDTLYGGLLKRPNSMLVVLTTAGFDRKSIGYEIYQYAKKVRDGAIKDDRWLPVIHELAEEEDWTLPANWRKANPNMGVTVREDDFALEVAKAKEQPSYQNTFRRLHLNQWTNQEHRSIDMHQWAACGGSLDLATLSKRRCWVGIDLSSKQDLTAATAVFPMDDGTYAVISKSWLPEEGLLQAARRKGVPLEAWVRDGYLETTPGAMVDYEYIRRALSEWREFYDIQQIIFDPWRDAQISASLMNDGFNIVEFPARPSKMNEPTRYLLALIGAGKLRHGDDPILSWNAGNLVTRTTLDGFIRPIKDPATPTQGIDALFAGILAMSGASGGDAPEIRIRTIS